jgi:hypothetical protein
MLIIDFFIVFKYNIYIILNNFEIKLNNYLFEILKLFPLYFVIYEFIMNF